MDAEALTRARELAAELAAGHPSYRDTPRDDLLPWQQQQVTFWALNLQGVIAGYVPGLLAEVDRLQAAEDTSSGAVPDLDPQEIGGVVGIYIVPEAPGQQPCLALRVLGGQKAYMRLWLRPPPTRVEWGWTLAKGAVCLWTNPELDDTPSYRTPEGA